MNNFLNKIINELDNKGIEQKWLAKKMGVTSTSIHYYLKGKQKMKFYPFYILISNTFTDKETIRAGLKTFIEHTTKAKDLKECLEWSFQNGEVELFDLAMEKAEQETSSVYQLLDLRRKKKISPKDLFIEVEQFKLQKFKDKELEILIQIITLYTLHDMKKFDVITLFTDNILKRLSLLKPDFLNNAFRIRVLELAAVSYLKQNDVENSIRLANEIINSIDTNVFPLPANSMLSLLGEAHVFTDYKKSFEYSKRALREFNELKFENYIHRKLALEATYDFIKITNNSYDKLYLTDKSEEAHFLAKQNDLESKEKALLILKEIEKEQTLSPHQLYYRALATSKREDYEKARKGFYMSGDLFYCKLVEDVVF